MITIFTKFELKEAVETMKGIEIWFNKHPKRKVCKTNWFKVKRGHIVEEVLKHTKNDKKDRKKGG